MAKWISEITLHHPIPVLQKLFTSRPTQIPQPRGHPQKEAHHLKSQPVPNSLSPTKPSRFCKSSLPLAPRDKPGCSGIGPERALDRSTPFPQRGSAIAPPPVRSLRVQALSRGAHPQEATHTTSPIPHQPSACPQTNQNPDTEAAAGQRRNEHRIEATNSQKRGSAKPHLPYDPCECRPCPAEPTQEAHHRVETSQARPRLFDWAPLPKCA